MSASLLPIPEEAVAAACGAEAEVAYGQEPFTRRDAMVRVAAVHAGLAAAWPVIVPAILRWAADELAKAPLEDYGPVHVEYDDRDECSGLLRSLADEVEGP